MAVKMVSLDALPAAGEDLKVVTDTAKVKQIVL